MTSVFRIKITGSFVLMALASWYVNSTFNNWGRVRARSGLTGAQAAQRLINNGGLAGVQVAATVPLEMALRVLHWRAVLESGAMFGELPLFDGSPRSADARALTESRAPQPRPAARRQGPSGCSGPNRSPASPGRSDLA